MSRFCMKVLAPAAALIGAVSIVSPASASETTFASYSAGKLTFSATQVGQSIKLTESGPVTFSFLNTNLSSYVDNVTATLTLSATGLNSDYTKIGPFADQEIISGTYSFISTQAYKIGGTTYAAHSNLLTVVFSDASVSGKIGTGDALFADDTAIGGTVTYTSDFLNFAHTLTRDFSISLGAISPKLGGTTALNPFTATPSGTFNSDPVPLSTAALPEPASWVMMLVGFGAIGLGLRGTTRRVLRTV